MENKPVIIRIKDKGDIRGYKKGFTEVYQKAFAEYPYYESFTDEQVLETIQELTFNSGGICYVMTLNGEVIGLCGGYSLRNTAEISELFKEHYPKVDLGNVFYFAELAVNKKYRRRGYGSMLIDTRIEFMKKHFVAGLQRTQVEGSNSLNLYKKRGFAQIPGMIQQVETYVMDSGQRKKVAQKRIFSIKFV